MLEAMNLAFVGIFTFELVVKVLSSGIHSYCLDNWNIFDATIMLFTYVDLAADSIIPKSMSSITSKLRIFRLFRFVRVIRRNKTLNEMSETFITALPSLWNALVLISLVFFVYGLLARAVDVACRLGRLDQNSERARCASKSTRRYHRYGPPPSDSIERPFELLPELPQLTRVSLRRARPGNDDEWQ